jgi:hypothetical protein
LQVSSFKNPFSLVLLFLICLVLEKKTFINKYAFQISSWFLSS